MLPNQSSIRLSHAVLALFFVLNVNADQFGNDYPVRYLSGGSSPLAKGGWRPIVTSDTLTAHFSNILGGQTLGQKILTGPALIETKVISPHIVNLGSYGNEIHSFSSTSTRPLVTRDVNKLTTLAQAYKSSLYPQGSFSLNAPVNTYMNPFSIPTGPGGSFKINPGYQYENTIYIKHQQPMMTHRPSYNKHQGPMMHGKRLKPNQMQTHMLQQLSTNSYHQPYQPTYQNNQLIKKPIEQYQRPIESYKKPVENFSKPHHNNYQKPVNPHDSLHTQTKTKHQNNQNIAAVTYKPPYNPHFQQFSIKEEPFGPIPSSILGSFSSFGHASVKAREPTNTRPNHTIQTTTPLTTTEAFSPVSPTNTVKPHRPPQEHKVNGPVKNNNIRNVHDEYTKNLVPPPHTSSFSDNKAKESQYKIQNTFIPSPPDPLNKNLNAPEILKPLIVKEKQSSKVVYNTNLSTKRPEVSSFFEAVPVSTSNPFESQSTKAPEGLIVQMPPPYSGKYNQVHHSKPVKFNIFDDHKYFPATRGQDLFGNKHVKNHELNTKVPYKGYEVTETWGSSGETNTQPTLHTWISPAQSYNHYNNGLKPPPVINVNVIPNNHENRIIPISYSPSPPPPPPKGSEGFIAYTTIPSVYSTIQNEHRDFFAELENSLSSLTEPQKIQPTGDEVFDLAAPINVTSFVQEEAPISSTTPAYEEVITTHRTLNRRKPNRNRYNYETSTISVVTEDLKEYTTRYESVKEEEVENDNDLQINDLATLPPNKYFKRPVTTTPTPPPPPPPPSIESWEEKLRKRNKNRRRRPLRVQSTTEEVVQETSTYTDHPIRSYKYRTTTMPTDVEEVTKLVRPRVRLPYRSRLTTKPTSQPELTSSAQPTIVPTSPVTSKPKLHSRIRLTTTQSFDLDDLSETTTSRSNRFFENYDKQSSIMKIAKDNHSNRLPPIKMRPYENSNDKPDYTHKQDEKDTPTSDIAVSTFDHKYSAQKLKDDLIDSSKELSELSDVIVEHTSQAYFLENLTENNAQLLTEQKLGNRGSVKQDFSKEDDSKETVEPTGEDDVITTTPTNKRLKIKPGKYETNRPRFSVKDYRNRLNQLSTSTDKPSQSTEAPVNNKLRFPNRSRFPSFKDQPIDNKPIGIDVSTSTEQPRKKFTPKDPRHKSNDEITDDENKEESISNIKVVQNVQDNEIVTKTVSKVRGSLRRDPNRTRITTTTVEPLELSDKTPQKPANIYTSVKRTVLRKRIQNKNATVTEMSVNNVTDSVSTSTETVTMMEEKVESSTEKHTSETAIMKIAKDDRKSSKVEDRPETSSSEISQRVSDLTLASGKEYNTPGLFKSVSPNTRRVPNYFTIATDDPILPIEAFFPQLNQKKES